MAQEGRQRIKIEQLREYQMEYIHGGCVGSFYGRQKKILHILQETH